MEKTAFAEVFGDTPFVRVLDFLLEEGRFFDYSLTDISDMAGVAWSTLNLIWPRFLKLKIVKPTRQIGRAKLYKLNTDSPLVRDLVQMDLQLSKALAIKTAVKVR